MQFKIHTLNSDGKKLILDYDNETNALSTETGHIFYDPPKEKSEFKTSIPFSKVDPRGKSSKIEIIKIQLGLSCNYSCGYCSQRFVERPTETSKKDVESFIEQINVLDFDEKTGLKIELWGGEPMVYWKTLVPLVEALQEKFASWKNKPRFSMITNGSLLTPEKGYWLMTNDFSVAISHDGPAQHQRGPDPFDDPKLKKTILDFWKQMHRMRRISFNSMLTASNTSRKEIHDWFIKLTDDPSVALGEGGIVDAYDEGGFASLLDTKTKHFAFRKQAFNDIYSTSGDVGFKQIVGKIDSFINNVYSQKPATSVGQKCGMDSENIIAVDLRGNILTCHNTSSVETSFNGESHLIGTVAKIDEAKLTTATHWRNRPHCAACPVLHLCSGSCMFLEGKNWTESCANAYSDNVALFSLAIEKITKGFVPYLIEGGDLPPERADIWGDVFKHIESTPKQKSFPVKIIAVEKNIEVNGVEVYAKSEVMHGV